MVPSFFYVNIEYVLLNYEAPPLSPPLADSRGGDDSRMVSGQECHETTIQLKSYFIFNIKYVLLNYIVNAGTHDGWHPFVFKGVFKGVLIINQARYIREKL